MMESLPLEILYMVISYIPLKDFKILFSTSKSLFQIGQDEKVWKMKFDIIYPYGFIPQLPIVSYRRSCLDICKPNIKAIPLYIEFDKIPSRLLGHVIMNREDIEFDIYIRIIDKVKSEYPDLDVKYYKIQNIYDNNIHTSALMDIIMRKSQAFNNKVTAEIEIGSTLEFEFNDDGSYIPIFISIYNNIRQFEIIYDKIAAKIHSILSK